MSNQLKSVFLLKKKQQQQKKKNKKKKKKKKQHFCYNACRNLNFVVTKCKYV